MVWNIVSMTISVIVGGIITYVVSRCYYIRAAQELKNETERLRNLLRIALQAMEDAHMVELRRDEAGRIIGMIQRANMVEGAEAGDKMESTSLNKTEKRNYPKGTDEDTNDKE